jgi:adenylate cyclase
MAQDAAGAAKSATANLTSAAGTRLDWPAIVNRARLISGLTMMCYVASHLLNHAIGIHSLTLMIAVQDWFVWFWQMKAMTAVLALAGTVHLGLAMWSIFRRRNLLAMKRWEAMQLIFGLLIPLLLIDHLVMTRIAQELYDPYVDYTYVLHRHFSDPIKPWLQAALLIVAWVHGMIGMNFWLRYKPWFPAWRPALGAVALLIPVLALTGYWTGAREVMLLSRDPVWLIDAMQRMNLPNEDAMDRLYGLRNLFRADN